MIDDGTDRLEGYVEVYLREEIRDEAAVQDVEAFEQFIEAAAISDGEMINYANIASDCGVAAKTLKAFKEEHPDCRLILVSLDPITRSSEGIELLYVNDFLRMLWNGEIF